MSISASASRTVLAGKAPRPTGTKLKTARESIHPPRDGRQIRHDFRRPAHTGPSPFFLRQFFAWLFSLTLSSFVHILFKTPSGSETGKSFVPANRIE